MSDVEKKKILMVDDDEIQLMTAEAMLMSQYLIFTARSGKEAIDYFLHGQIPDLILLDIMMPDMDGWETYNRLRAVSKLKDVPIAFLTSITDSFEKSRAMGMGVADFITKPFDQDSLLSRVKNIMEMAQKS